MKLKSKKWLTFILTLFLTSQAQANPWADFEEGGAITLKQDLKISDQMQIPRGTQFIIHDALTLDPVPVMIYTMHAVGCHGSNDWDVVDLTILADGNGFEWMKTCRANFYVEFKDLGSESYFEKIDL